jgi:Fic family protein
MDSFFTTLGFRWDGAALGKLPVHSVRRAVWRFNRMLPEFVWDAGVLEGNPFTFPEVQTLLDGVTVGGRKLSDQNQILNLIASSKYLVSVVKSGEFSLDRAMFCTIQNMVAKEEALEWGMFRGEGKETAQIDVAQIDVAPIDVALGEYGRHVPLPTVPGASELICVFEAGRAVLETFENSFEKAAAFFLFGALQQFFFDGNKRTSRFMMNGVLMSSGIDAISVPAAKAQEFNEKMVRFYLSRDGTEMMHFLKDCHPTG